MLMSNLEADGQQKIKPGTTPVS